MNDRSASPFAFLATLLTFALTTRAMGQTVMPSPVAVALDENARSMSPISVEWERTRTSDYPIDRLLQTIKFSPHAIHVLEPEKARVKWRTGGFRCYSRGVTSRLDEKRSGDKVTVAINKDDRFRVRIKDRSWDGTNFYNANPSSDVAIVLIDSVQDLTKASPQQSIFEPEYLEYAGFFIPHRLAELREMAHVRSAVLYLIEGGAKVDAVQNEKPWDGAACTVISVSNNKRKTDFYLDPQLHYAVRRRVERSLQDELVFEVNCKDFTRIDNTSLYLPRSVRVDWHTWVTIRDVITGPALFHETFKVEKISHAPIPDHEFVVDYRKPGTMVKDSTIPEANGKPVEYRIPAKAEDLDAAIKGALEFNRGRGSTFGTTMAILLANAVILALGVCIYFFRRARHH